MDYPINQWVSLPAERFKTYQHWKTPSGFLCGTYASSVLLAYYQDYIDEQILPVDVRRKGTSSNRTMIPQLKPYLQPIDAPTMPVQISFGLCRFFAHVNSPYRSRFTSVGAWQRAVKRISEGKPVMVGVLKVLGSTYGNHWVVAYGFYESAAGKRYYKIHDNWGNYQKIIPASWANGTISFP
ncbi:hypothetical protein NRIC_14140 [Enterococcus florum]|uniref:Peptidase C39-like domain-containing protein n=1 Tax=Enterococcus florum TaxID=2480627 RepID=A0A4P5PJL4_9ENTE|nr:hypothetical protein [Enterococcus florum]GCF93523.1 hypothetical protein NRIC_14140 [Enterococcus florum]